MASVSQDTVKNNFSPGFAVLVYLSLASSLRWRRWRTIHATATQTANHSALPTHMMSVTTNHGWSTRACRAEDGPWCKAQHHCHHSYRSTGTTESRRALRPLRFST